MCVPAQRQAIQCIIYFDPLVYFPVQFAFEAREVQLYSWKWSERCRYYYYY